MRTPSKWSACTSRRDQRHSFHHGGTGEDGDWAGAVGGGRRAAITASAAAFIGTVPIDINGTYVDKLSVFSTLPLMLNPEPVIVPPFLRDVPAV